MADVVLNGSGTETINPNGTVTLQIPEIVNDLSGTTGDVHLELWATTSPWSPGASGSLIATDDLGKLTSGQTLSASKTSLNLNDVPTTGTYYLTLVLTEYTGASTDGGYSPQSYIPFSPPTTLTPIHFDTSGANWSMNFGTNTATLDIPQIDNNSGAATGALRVELWATSTQYHGGALSGQLLAEQQVNSLAAGQTDSASTISAAMAKLPAGTYYTALVLTEYTGASPNVDNGYVVQNYFSNSNSITITAPVSVQAAITAFAAGGSSSISISDSAANVAGSLDNLQSIAAGGELSTITLTDSGTPTLSITAAQLSGDAAALNDISSNYNLSVTAGLSAVNITGPAGHATTVNFTGNASQYTVTTSNGVVSVTSGGVTDQLTNVAAIKFADFTEIVAATPGAAAAPTTGNITELYSAVLAREPDVSGLAFYQNYLKANPNTPLQTFATFFLNSSEYTSNSAHNYAETTAGDTQFITDSYQNLLHRTPAASEVSFYENNVLAPAVAGLTAGTQAYANAQLQAHALMLVYFSASSEFLGDVQITASNPASASHWLFLT